MSDGTENAPGLTIVTEAVSQINVCSAPLSAVVPVDATTVQHPYSMNGRVPVKTVLNLGLSLVGQTVVIGGWVKTGREQGKGAFAFLEVNDGSCQTNIQIVVPQEVHDISLLTTAGTSILIKGVIKAIEQPKKQFIEMMATEVQYVGACDGATYPIAKGKLTLEFLRSHIHFRTRTNTIAAITRIRNCLATATHNFFQQQGFLYVHTPLITASDCEGAGEMFQV